NLFRSALFGCAALFFVALTAGQARADGIMYKGPDPCFPAGVGRGCGPDRAPHVLTLQQHGTEDGAVGRSTSTSGDVRTGDWQRGSNTQTVTLAQIGTTNAGDIEIYFDINEPNSGQTINTVTLNSLVLNAYDSAGNNIFSASLLPGTVPDGGNLSQLGSGQGHSDYVFGLDPAAAARLQAAINAHPDLRLGLSANISSAQGGPESFFIGSAPAAVPEPTTMFLFGTGLAGLAARARKRRKQAAAAKDAGTD
ncbi:MAG TPA: PEP-CTERM sorting domain-containing protein, partial [Pyrinomonadaceae bacterium]|nr:PEP-CTERM sorting domain-containing protein [Pyrinomonadaceae bacterium]